MQSELQPYFNRLVCLLKYKCPFLHTDIEEPLLGYRNCWVTPLVQLRGSFSIHFSAIPQSAFRHSKFCSSKSSLQESPLPAAAAMEGWGIPGSWEVLLDIQFIPFPPVHPINLQPFPLCLGILQNPIPAEAFAQLSTETFPCPSRTQSAASWCYSLVYFCIFLIPLCRALG